MSQFLSDYTTAVIGDGDTKVIEWTFLSQSGVKEYGIGSDKVPAFRDSTKGIYMVFYGASKLDKEDYSIREEDSTLVLSEPSKTSDEKILVCFIGK